MSKDTPAIDTDRLTLRGHRPEDLGECAAMWADPTVTRFIGGKPLSEEETWSRLLRYVGHWAVLGFGYWVVREKVSGRLVGEVGFADLKRELTPSLGGAPEAGWVLSPWAHGKGYATEAVRGAIAWIEANRRPARTVCLIAPENTASIRVAERCGYSEWTRTTYKGEPTILFQRHSAGST